MWSSNGSSSLRVFSQFEQVRHTSQVECPFLIRVFPVCVKARAEKQALSIFEIFVKSCVIDTQSKLIGTIQRQRTFGLVLNLFS